MGVFSSNLKSEVRLERMRPAQIDEAMARRAAVYVPFGSIEWHGRQNPVGLDAIKAHEQLVGLASRAGGVVYPPVFFSSGGGHSDYTHSFMFDPAPMRRLTADLLSLFERDGFKAAILLSGHYPNKIEFMEAAIETFRQRSGKMSILALVENEPPGLAGDHAAKWETSYQLYLHPETVDMTQLDGRPDDFGGPQQVVNWMKDELKDHPCYGIIGVDPRPHASAAVGAESTEKLISYLSGWLDQTGV